MICNVGQRALDYCKTRFCIVSGFTTPFLNTKPSRSDLSVACSSLIPSMLKASTQPLGKV